MIAHGIGQAGDWGCAPESMAGHYELADQATQTVAYDDDATDAGCCTPAPCGVAVIPPMATATLVPTSEASPRLYRRLDGAGPGRIERPPIPA